MKGNNSKVRQGNTVLINIKKWMKSLSVQIFLGIILGIIAGIVMPAEWCKYFAFLGKIFKNSLLMIVGPLVFSSIFMGIAGLGDLRKLGRMGIYTALFYFSTTIISVIIGLTLVNIIEPGRDFPLEKFLSQIEEQPESMEKMAEINEIDPTISGFFDHQIDTILTNPATAIASSPPNVLAIIFFSLLLAIFATMIGEKGRPLISFFDSFNNVMMRITKFIMWIAPWGVFALIANMVASVGMEGLIKMGNYMLTVIAGLLIHSLLILTAVVWIFGRVNPVHFFKNLSLALITAFSTSSSSATMPVTIRSLKENMNVKEHAVEFVVPLGATINMDGTALYEAVGAMFIAQIYGIDLSLTQQIIISLTATLAAIGAAGIPSAGTVTMAMVCTAVGLPLEGILIILAVDRILDMIRTTVNVQGDCVGAIVIARFYGDKKK